MQIFKYEIELKHEPTLNLPDGFKILSFQNQNEKPVIWCLINSNSPVKKVNFKIIPTGDKTNVDGYDYVGTAQFMNGKLVWHLFVEATKQEH